MDKLTDSEIVKVLDTALGMEHISIYCANIKNEVKTIKVLDIIDLINRLQADCENYKQVAENQQKATLDKSFEVKRLRTQVDRLQAENTELVGNVDNLKEEVANMDKVYFDVRTRLETAKAEAYKEFAERLKEKLDPTLMAITKIGCVLVDVSKSHISPDSAIEKIREHLKGLEIETRLSFDMFVCDLLK